MRPLFYILFEIKLIPTFSGFGFGYQPERIQGSIYWLFYTWQICALHYTWQICALHYTWQICALHYTWQICALHLSSTCKVLKLSLEPIMTTWLNIRLQDAAFSFLEQVIFFHDHTVTVILIITIVVIYMITTLLQGSWPLEMETIDCFETPVRKCHYSLRDIQLERSYQYQICFEHFYRPFHYG
jgi:hypothetical protein